ncbi:hypothetical protein K9L97_02015 [Candidatus Woesearchaeota archaeon]|nr:hypothetical protein [Candidatus Woesearchaeota archaeon]
MTLGFGGSVYNGCVRRHLYATCDEKIEFLDSDYYENIEKIRIIKIAAPSLSPP